MAQRWEQLHGGKIEKTQRRGAIAWWEDREDTEMGATAWREDREDTEEGRNSMVGR